MNFVPEALLPGLLVDLSHIPRISPDNFDIRPS
jgi:hypothetical protein